MCSILIRKINVNLTMGDRQALAMDGRQKVGRFTQTSWLRKVCGRSHAIQHRIVKVHHISEYFHAQRFRQC